MEQAVEDAIAALLKAWSDQDYSREDLEVDAEGRTITVNVPDDDNAYEIEFDEFVEIIDELKWRRSMPRGAIFERSMDLIKWCCQ